MPVLSYHLFRLHLLTIFHSQTTEKSLWGFQMKLVGLFWAIFFIYLRCAVLISLRQLKGCNLIPWYPEHKCVFGSQKQIIVFIQMIHNMITDKFLGYHTKHRSKSWGDQESSLLKKKWSFLVHHWSVSCYKHSEFFLLFFWGYDKQFYRISS